MPARSSISAAMMIGSSPSAAKSLGGKPIGAVLGLPFALIAENLTAAEARLLVEEILDRMPLPKLGSAGAASGPGRWLLRAGACLFALKGRNSDPGITTSRNFVSPHLAV